MKFLHQGESIPVSMNNIVKVILTDTHAYYYDSGTLKSYERGQLIMATEADDPSKIVSFNAEKARVLNFIKGDNDILFYLKKRISEAQYFEFERFLFERT